jgi:PAS domain S-box-containing protein
MPEGTGPEDDYRRSTIGRPQADPDPRATQQFRLAIEAAPTGMIMVDDRGRIVLVNSHAERLFGYAREEVIGQPIERLFPERFRSRPEFLESFFGEARSSPMGAGRDLFGLCKDGTEIPIELGLNPIRTREGEFVLSSVADITERKRAEEERNRLMGELWTLNAELEKRVRERTAELTAALEEREVLLQEVHHRVKNNLQVISSLINMQRRSLVEEAGREALAECQSRVLAIALIHEKLYQARDYAHVPFSEYARSLAGNIFEATGVSPDRVSLELAIDEVALAVDKAIPCGLILNELITNAVKHAFPDGRTGTIRVELGHDGDGTLRLLIGDDGQGLPPGFDATRSDSLGLHLVRMLAAQLNAALDVETGNGTSFRLTLREEA